MRAKSAPSPCCAPSALPSSPPRHSRRSTAICIACGSIPIGCTAAVAPACCPTDRRLSAVFSFASGLQVWVTWFSAGGEHMAQDRRSVRALASLLPAGALGLSVSLASADAAATASSDPDVKKPEDIAQRLQSIRLSVSDALEQYAKDGEPFVAIDRETQLAWWGNGGWRNGGWRNAGWGNGGWHNWGNGGWHN